MTGNPPALKIVRRLRARRIRPADFSLGAFVASGQHHCLGRLSGYVEDLSVYGLALIVPGRSCDTQVPLGGDRLEDLTISDSEHTIFRGTAVVRRVSERAGELMVGVEFEGGGLDLAEVYRRGTRRSFAERWKAQASRRDHERISDEFKAWVLDLRIDLEQYRDFLNAEQTALQQADDVTRREAEAEYLEEIAPLVVERLNRAGAELGPLVEQVPDEEQPAWRSFCSTQLAHLFALSPFMKRASDKPLGYAGDYEMMNMLYRDHAEGPSLFGKALNLYATQEAAARANINRIELLDGLIRDFAAKTPGPIRLASVGCGPAHEIAVLLRRWPELGPRLQVALIDQEERSIAWCERRLSPLANRTGARIEFIRESIRRLIGSPELARALGPRELIYSAGLFDYLNTRSFCALLGALYAALVKGGLLAVGNVAVNNPSRHAMEYFSGWFLIHRSAEELRGFANDLTPAPRQIEVGSEPLGVNLFLYVRK
jgi:extracellular factor (EF) 3-hydroxypalmitic acid methyl ester biosynthesis protein